MWVRVKNFLGTNIQNLGSILVLTCILYFLIDILYNKNILITFYNFFKNSLELFLPKFNFFFAMSVEQIYNLCSISFVE